MKFNKIIALTVIVCLLAVILCVPAFATVTESIGDNYALYNSVKLPSLDAFDLDISLYPLLMVSYPNPSITTPYLFTFIPVTNVVANFYDEGNYYFLNSTDGLTHNCRRFYYYPSSGQIQPITFVELEPDGGMLAGDWFNYSVYTADNELIFPAGSYTSLDGMNVIEWDGDTTDLSAVGNKYTVADYVNASDAVAVQTNGTSLIASTNFGNSDGVWTVAGSDGTTGYAFANPSEGIGAFKYSDTVYTSLIAYREAETPPEESQPPSGGEGETTGGISSAELEASQAAQTAEIVAKVESESNIIQAAISSLEAALNNSDILNYLKQALSFRDFDLETGALSTTTQTFEGIVPLFGHWAQNTENYLGRIVSTLANEKEEEVVEKTTGFWDLLIALFTPNADTGKAEADATDLSKFIDFAETVGTMVDFGGELDDFQNVMGSDSTWMIFSPEVQSNVDAVPTTYSRYTRGAPEYYHFADQIYADFYSEIGK